MNSDICFTVKKVLCIQTEMLFSRIILIVVSPSGILLEVKALCLVYFQILLKRKSNIKLDFFYCFFIYYYTTIIWELKNIYIDYIKTLQYTCFALKFTLKWFTGWLLLIMYYVDIILYVRWICILQASGCFLWTLIFFKRTKAFSLIV